MASLGYSDYPRFLQDFISKIEGMINDEVAMLANGYATTFEDYRYRIGIIDGLRSAKDEAVNVLGQQQG